MIPCLFRQSSGVNGFAGSKVTSSLKPGALQLDLKPPLF